VSNSEDFGGARSSGAARDGEDSEEVVLLGSITKIFTATAQDMQAIYGNRQIKSISYL
jgi:CubicO group peptidase (beta-lactamase class C family)